MGIFDKIDVSKILIDEATILDLRSCSDYNKV